MAADVSINTAAAYSMLGVTTAAIAEAAVADVTVTTATSANLSTAEAAASDLPVPVDTSASSSIGKAISEAAAADVSFKLQHLKPMKKKRLIRMLLKEIFRTKGSKG